MVDNQISLTPSLISSPRILMPVISVEEAIDRYNQIRHFINNIMQEDVDYGKSFPGDTKKNLKKPGAEKLCTLFGLVPRPNIIERVEDWIGANHNGEPLFYYLYRCSLYNSDKLVAEADGSCNSFESKYRYRKAERICPICSVSSIIRSKYDDGWYCFPKKGGCAAKFMAGDRGIESQNVDRILNVDIYDYVNTIDKMAQKRAFIAATLIAVNASDYFTQDLEDFESFGEMEHTFDIEQGVSSGNIESPISKGVPRKHQFNSRKSKRAKITGGDKDTNKGKIGKSVDHNDFWSNVYKHNVTKAQAMPIVEACNGDWELALKQVMNLSSTEREVEPEDPPDVREKLNKLIAILQNQVSLEEINKHIALECDGLFEVEQLDLIQIQLAIDALNNHFNIPDSR